jgi:hypothetical protein
VVILYLRFFKDLHDSENATAPKIKTESSLSIVSHFVLNEQILFFEGWFSGPGCVANYFDLNWTSGICFKSKDLTTYLIQ